MEEVLKNLLGTHWGAMAAKILPVVAIIIIGYFLINFIMKFVVKIIEKSKLPKNVHSFARSLIKILLYFFVVLIVCDKLGINVTSLVAAFSIVGVAFSLSLQSSLSNVMSGITILFTKQFEVDDYIEAGGVSGTVMAIGLSHCKLRTPDNKEIFVPNSTIITEKIINYSNEPTRRVDITIGASYNEDIDKVKKALMSVVEDTPEVLKDKDVFVGITAYQASCIDYTVRVWVKNSDYWNAYLPMLEKIKRVFDANKIEIPYNQLDVHISNN
ncbi:MAG: mechanosensitive ion channel [Clostridia bacterium]|nr:mechanosensitive ion channel [Clostridia bacterium]